MMENGGIFSQTLIPIGNSPTSALWFATPGCLPQRKSRRRSESDKISPQDVFSKKTLNLCVCVIKTLNCLRVFVHSHGKVVLHLSSCVQLPSILSRSWKPSKMPQSCYYCPSIHLHKVNECLCWFYYTSFFSEIVCSACKVMIFCWGFDLNSVCRMASRTVEPNPRRFKRWTTRRKKGRRSPTTWGIQSREGGTKSKVTSPFQIVIPKKTPGSKELP